MNTNKNKFLLFSLFIFSFLVLMPNVLANTTTQMAEYVAENPCDENSIRVILRVFGYILLIARIAVPLIIIGFGTFDLFKSVVDKDEKSLGKQVKRLGIRVFAGLLVFFVPNIVSVFFSLSDKLNIMETDQYKTCSNCLLKPNSCEVEDINKIEDTNSSDNTSGLADKNGNCPSGSTKGIDGICYKEGACGSYSTKDTCPDSCKWSARNGCQSK